MSAERKELLALLKTIGMIVALAFGIFAMAAIIAVAAIVGGMR